MQEPEKRKNPSAGHWFLHVQRPKPTLRLTVWMFCLLFVVTEGAIIRHVVNRDILDARLAYTPAQALSMFESLDAASRAAYRTFNKIDFAVIVLYSALLVAWFRLLGPDFGGKLRHWHWLGLVPGMFDLCETIGVAILLYSEHPGYGAGLWLAVLGTPMKWLGAGFALLLLVFAEVRGLHRRRLQGRSWHDISPAPREDLPSGSEPLPPDAGGVRCD